MSELRGGPLAMRLGCSIRHLARRHPSAACRTSARSLASIVFDRKLKRHHRERTALSPHHAQYAYLRDEVAERLADRLDDVHSSYKFNDAVDLGCGTGHMRRAMAGRGVGRLLECDLSSAMLAASAADAAASGAGAEGDAPMLVTQRELDDEMPLLEKESADLIVSSMNLHWVNDLPGSLSAIRRALRPNGLFLGAMLGGETLAEMRSAFVLADLERRGGVAQRMSPLCSVADAGALVQGAGFALPAVDTEVITIRYPDAWTLWHHLRSMGESIATVNRASADRETLVAAAAIYSEVYGDPTDGSIPASIPPLHDLHLACKCSSQRGALPTGSIPASFQIIYMTGWSPHESQQRPLSRGSGAISLKDLNLPGFGITDLPTESGGGGGTVR